MLAYRYHGSSSDPHPPPLLQNSCRNDKKFSKISKSVPRLIIYHTVFVYDSRLHAMYHRSNKSPVVDDVSSPLRQGFPHNTAGRCSIFRDIKRGSQPQMVCSPVRDRLQEIFRLASLARGTSPSFHPSHSFIVLLHPRHSLNLDKEAVLEVSHYIHYPHAHFTIATSFCFKSVIVCFVGHGVHSFHRFTSFLSKR